MKRTAITIATASPLVTESHTVILVREGKQIPGLATEGGGRNFRKPVDKVGATSIPKHAGTS